VLSGRQQALFPGRKTLAELARWTPAQVTAWRFRRVLNTVYWDIHVLVEWWIQEALNTLPPPQDGVLYVVGDGSEILWRFPLAPCTRPFPAGVQHAAHPRHDGLASGQRGT
jgi:hypothetical protein